MMNNKKQKYWKTFYKSKKLNSFIDFPSQFSIFTLSKKKKEKVLLEFGCGNGRDASYMSQFYKKTFAFDLNRDVIKLNRLKYRNLKSLKFNVCDINDYFDIKKYKSFKKIIYARFFLHSLTDLEIKYFLLLVTQLLNKKEKMFVEYRTHLDEKKKKFFKNHFRNFLNPNKIIRYCSKVNLKNIYSIKGNGLAIFNEEDPNVARQIFEKK